MSYYFIKIYDDKLGDIRFRMTGEKRENLEWIKALKRGMSMFFGFIGPVEEDLYNRIIEDAHRGITKPCIFELTSKIIKINEFRYSEINSVKILLKFGKLLI